MNMSPTENDRKFESSTTLQFSLSEMCNYCCPSI